MRLRIRWGRGRIEESSRPAPARPGLIRPGLIRAGLILGGLALVGSVLGACGAESTAGPESADTSAPVLRPPTVEDAGSVVDRAGPATKVELSIGDPMLGFVTTVWSDGDAIGATSVSVAGLIAEERIVDGIYFVHVAHAAPIFGFEGWLGADLSTELGRLVHDEHRYGLVDLVDVAAVPVGAELMGGLVTDVDTSEAGTVRLVVTGVGDVVVRTSVVPADVPELAAPHEWVSLPEILAAR